MRSSYLQNNYPELLTSIARIQQPNKIVEFGLLDGVSLRALKAGSPHAQITGFDIFQEFAGHYPDRDALEAEFGFEAILYGDFYKIHETLPNGSIGLLHIDIANDGAVYEFALRHYLSKIQPGGVMLLEGGPSEERERVWWMQKFNKRPIREALGATSARWFSFGPFPGLTMVQP